MLFDVCKKRIEKLRNFGKQKGAYESDFTVSVQRPTLMEKIYTRAYLLFLFSQTAKQFVPSKINTNMFVNL